MNKNDWILLTMLIAVTILGIFVFFTFETIPYSPNGTLE